MKAESDFLLKQNMGRLERKKVRIQERFDKQWNKGLKKLSGSEPSKEVIDNEIDQFVKKAVESL